MLSSGCAAIRYSTGYVANAGSKLLYLNDMAGVMGN